MPQATFSHVALPGMPVTTHTSYLLLQGGWLRGHHRVSDVGLLRARGLVEPRGSLAHGVTRRIRRLGLPGALWHVGRFGAVPAAVPPVVGVLVAALRGRVSVGGLGGPAGRRGVAVVGPVGLWRSVLRAGGLAGRCGAVGLAGPQAAVVPGLRAGWLVVRAGLRRPHLHVEGRAARRGGRGVGGRHRLRLQGAHGSDRDGRWLPRALGSGFFGGREGRLVGDDHPLVAGDRGGHGWGGGSSAARGPGALGSKERDTGSAEGATRAPGWATMVEMGVYSNFCAATQTA